MALKPSSGQTDALDASTLSKACLLQLSTKEQQVCSDPEISVGSEGWIANGIPYYQEIIATSSPVQATVVPSVSFSVHIQKG